MTASATNVPGNVLGDVSKETALQLYRGMLAVRMFEERMIELSTQGKVGGNLHLDTGQEAIAVGVCHALAPSDLVVGTHRSLAHAIAKGADLRKLAAEMLGKATGYCKGRGGKMHLTCPEVGFVTANGIVGAGLGIAAGVALRQKMTGSGPAVVSFFGDGAVNHAYFHETANLASLWNLPLLMICENNGYAVSVRADRAMAGPGVVARAAAYGIEGESVDGNDVMQVSAAAKRALGAVHAGNGPRLIECRTIRVHGHHEGDQQHYRPREEIEEAVKRDPIDRMRGFLVGQGWLTVQEETALQRELASEIDDAVAFAEQSPSPAVSELHQHVYGEERAGGSRP
ncbi:MAG: thiamine pyrophosphate-dependent dehydrogenase E1 component subunit alpha [Firmicutes bacterium]|nr:thiamine pyrophosphate-dependent dehydrogenase E1 component subunit alpha [Bacillota bacterium]